MCVWELVRAPNTEEAVPQKCVTPPPPGTLNPKPLNHQTDSMRISNMLGKYREFENTGFWKANSNED